MISMLRIVMLLCFGAVIAAGLWVPVGYSQEKEWPQTKAASIDPSMAQSDFFAGTPEEVAARIDNLELLREDPVRHTLAYDDRGPVSKSIKRYLAFSPDMHRVFGLTVTCTGTCSGNGCGTSGCNIVAGDCSACNCTGCGSECTCSKTSTWTDDGFETENPGDN